MKSVLFKQATGRNILVFLVLYVAMVAFVMVPAQKFMETHGEGTGPLDLQQFYNADKALEMLGQYDAEVRAFYRKTELTADLAYPVVYTLFLGLLWLFLLKKAFAPGHFVQRLWFVPFVGFFFDLIENACILRLLGQSPDFSRGTAVAASVFSGLKWGFAFASMGLVVMGLIVWLVRAVRKRPQGA